MPAAGKGVIHAPARISALLDVRHLDAWQGATRVLHDVSLTVGAGEVVALFGRNGTGRSTLAKAIVGLVERRGSVMLDGIELVDKRTFEIARAGVGYVAESRDVFPRLTVHENLVLGLPRGARGSRASLDALYEMFPILRARSRVRAGVLSGGEQQMLAIARALAGEPRVMIVDEPTEGLAPRVVAELGASLAALAARGTAILLIEQRSAIALELARRVHVMGHGPSGYGEIVFSGTRDAFVAAPEIAQQWLSV
jgi:branched-chain amino acid transport system ATP-binding protein